MESALYKVYYNTYPFEVATRLCIEYAQKLVEVHIEERMRVIQALHEIKDFKILSLNTGLTAYDIVQKQIMDLLREEGMKMGFKITE